MSEERKGLLPVTLLSGFLGSGKTTLLKHILEEKHTEENGAFRCAVIVNDVAELNIDKSLVDQASFVQSDEVIAMQNGCVCCTLKSDLLEQMIEMASKKKFDYMIIETSGISEPSQIIQLFDACDDDHDHDEAHGDEVVLSDVARLDTCVTLVDSADFFNKFETVVKGANNEAWSKLMVEQIEFANVIVINKADLVSQSQIDKVGDHISVLNPNAKTLISKYSAIDVMEVVDTKLYKPNEFEDILSKLEVFEEEKMKECCTDSTNKGKSPCCDTNRTFETDLSKVMLSSTNEPKTRHEVRFGITSFSYQARRPFNSLRLHNDFINKYFVFIEDDQADEEEEDVQREAMIAQKQKEAATKTKKRVNDLGNVLRSKGFVWAAHTHDWMVAYGQAGNAATFEIEGCWKVLESQAWTGSKEEIAIFRKNFAGPYGDRRQELVFIGHNMNHFAIQESLDDCLLTDEEFEMGIDGWKATIGDAFLGDECDEHE